MVLQNIEVEARRRVEGIQQLLGAEVRRVAGRQVLQKFEAKVRRGYGRIRRGGRRLRVLLLLLGQAAHSRATSTVLLMRVQRRTCEEKRLGN